MALSFSPMKKVEIVVERSQMKNVIKLLDSSGATGYTIFQHVDGKGMRGMREEALQISDVMRNIMIITVVPESVAFKIMEGLQKVFENYSGISYLSDVNVERKLHFGKTE